MSFQQLLETSNFSLFAIPAYCGLCYLPHLYGGGLLKVPKEAARKSVDGKLKEGQLFYNMPNPRSTSNAAKYSQLLGDAQYQKYERCRATHQNLLESAPFVLSALIVGTFTNLPPYFMNTISAAYLLTRVLYIFTYIRTAKGPWAVERTFWFMLGNAMLVAVWIKAAKKIAYGEA